ncbi:MAG TPA: GTP pyrophosphokinase [Acidimicrobiaceae bacterium]|nr:GTP pyrophosphokinase [Acidimicrobiaceae bacterium]
MATVGRVLPWRRHQLPPAQEIERLLEEFRRFHPRAAAEPIIRAYEVARAAHEGQTRKSGEPYVTHPLAVATIVAHYGMDAATVVAALLHDAVEDTEMTLAEVSATFGEEVAGLVDGVTKLEGIHFDSKAAQQAATIRKVIVATARDLRVLVIKLADRTHNMRTIAGISAEKQQKTAIETRDVYAPLAHRLGMGDIKQQLEDICFASLHPKRYAEIDHMVAVRAPEREIYLAQIEEELRTRLADAHVKAEVTGRPKHLWSIYEKMVVRGRDFDEIFDLVGIRVVVDSYKDCYAALGSIHSLWPPVHGRFKDYIAQPKFNLYQSIHTTVVGPQGKPVEVQVRTREMHLRAESGIAAHFAYKEGETAVDELGWLNRMMDWQHEVSDPEEFMANLKIDLETDEIFVFTPKGDVIPLPQGSTPVDFAYAVHTEVGHRCVGARVGGRLVPLDTRLKSGDTVEVYTSKVDGAKPSEAWLETVASRSAQTKIKQYFSRDRRVDVQVIGNDLLERAIRSAGMAISEAGDPELLTAVAKELNYASGDALVAAIGDERCSVGPVVDRIQRHLRAAQDARSELVNTPTRNHKRRGSGSGIGINAENLDDVVVRVALCCQPIPGDEILGFHTRGRGISVHRMDCANAVSLSAGHSGRVVEVQWDDDSGGTFMAAIEVRAIDRSGLLVDVTRILTEGGVSIDRCSTHTSDDRVSTLYFEFELGDAGHLGTILSRLRGLDSVYHADRATERPRL